MKPPSLGQVIRYLQENKIPYKEDYLGMRCFVYWEGNRYCYDTQDVFYVDGHPADIDWELDIFRNVDARRILKRIAECS